MAGVDYWDYQCILVAIVNLCLQNSPIIRHVALGIKMYFINTYEYLFDCGFKNSKYFFN